MAGSSGGPSRVCVKLYAEDRGIGDQTFVPIFHEWIRDQALEGLVLFDVADYAHVPDSPGIVLVTYEITCEKGLDAAQAGLVKSFLTYAASDAVQGALSSTGYVPITGDLLTKVRASVAAIA